MPAPTQTWIHWLRVCAKDRPSMARHPGPLGMLTVQDYQVLAAIAECWKLYAAASDAAGESAALLAVRSLLPALQPKCHGFACELIAFAMDWDDRQKLWPLVKIHQSDLAKENAEALERDIDMLLVSRGTPYTQTGQSPRIGTPLLEELIHNKTTHHVHEHIALDLLDARKGH